MREWPGIRDDQTDVGGDGLADVTGVSYAVEGELRRRPGLTYLAAHGGSALAHFRSPLAGAWLLVVKASGEVESVAL